MSQWLGSLPASLVQSLIMAGASSLTSARDRDALLLLMTCCLELGVKSFILPASLVFDESNRLTIQQRARMNR